MAANKLAELTKLLRSAIEGNNPDVDAAVLKAGYVHGPGWTVNSTAEVARFLGLTNRRVQELVSQDGMPRKKVGIRYEYDLSEIVQWRAARKEEPQDDEDEYRGNSPEAEKLRRVQREIKEMERDRMRRQLVDLQTVRDGLAVMSSVLRDACDRMQLQFGEGCRKVFADAVGTCEREIKRQFHVEDQSA